MTPEVMARLEPQMRAYDFAVSDLLKAIELTAVPYEVTTIAGGWQATLKIEPAAGAGTRLRAEGKLK